MQIYFSPLGGCTQQVCSQIAASRKSIRVQAYEFTSQRIAQALILAAARGVSVQVILDAGAARQPSCLGTLVAQRGIPVFLDALHHIAHNKVMVLDETVLITGSFNFTDAAESSNAENLLTLPDPSAAATYLANWQAHSAHSKPFVLPQQAQAPLAPAAS